MKKGFTLSEVLITLGIIGTIAALTIPIVVANYKNKLYATQMKKTYGQIIEAAQTIMNDEHTNNFYTTSAGIPQDDTTENCKTGACYFLRNYFKTINENCATGDHKCVGDSYKTLKGGTTYPPATFCVQTTNGATICAGHNSTNQVTSITVDINGKDGPNIAGRDVFSMDMKTDGSLSDYGSGSNDPNIAGADADLCGAADGNVSILNEAARGCLTKLIESGWVMDY